MKKLRDQSFELAARVTQQGIVVVSASSLAIAQDKFHSGDWVEFVPSEMVDWELTVKPKEEI